MWLETNVFQMAHSCSKVVYNLWVLGHPARPKQLWTCSRSSQEGHIWGKDEIFAETQLWGDSGCYQAFVFLPNAFFLSPFEFFFRKSSIQFCTSGVLTRNLTKCLTTCIIFLRTSNLWLHLSTFYPWQTFAHAVQQMRITWWKPNPHQISYEHVSLSTHNFSMLSTTNCPGQLCEIIRCSTYWVAWLHSPYLYSTLSSSPVCAPADIPLYQFSTTLFTLCAPAVVLKIAPTQDYWSYCSYLFYIFWVAWFYYFIPKLLLM